MTPMTRPQTWPDRTAKPANSTSSPTNRWIQPQLVASNSSR